MELTVPTYVGTERKNLCIDFCVLVELMIGRMPYFHLCL